MMTAAIVFIGLRVFECPITGAQLGEGQNAKASAHKGRRKELAV
jgi:hypothetical protein